MRPDSETTLPTGEFGKIRQLIKSNTDGKSLFYKYSVLVTQTVYNSVQTTNTVEILNSFLTQI